MSSRIEEETAELHRYRTVSRAVLSSEGIRRITFISWNWHLNKVFPYNFLPETSFFCISPSLVSHAAINGPLQFFTVETTKNQSATRKIL